MFVSRLVCTAALVLLSFAGDRAVAVAPPPRVDAAGFLLPPHARLRLGLMQWRLPDRDSAVSVDVSPDGRLLVAAGHKGSVVIWDLHTGQTHRTRDLGRDLRQVSFAGRGRTLLVDDARTVALLDVDRGVELARIHDLDAHHVPPAVARHGATIALCGEAGSSRCIVRLMDGATGKILVRKDLSPHKAGCAALSPDGRILATGHDDTRIRLWDTEWWKELPPLVGLEQSPHWVAFAPDGRLLAAAAHGLARAQVWEVKTGKALLQEKERPEAMRFAMLPDGQSLALIFPNRVERWSLATRKATAWLRDADLYSGGFAFTPDGTRLAEGTTALQMRDVQTGKSLHLTTRAEGLIREVGFLADGQRVYAPKSGAGFRLWDLHLRKEIRPEKGKSFLALSPDGRIGVTDFPPGTFVDVTSGRVLHRLQPPTWQVPRIPGRGWSSVCGFDWQGRASAVVSFGPGKADGYKGQIATFSVEAGEIRPVRTVPVGAESWAYRRSNRLFLSPGGEVFVVEGVLPEDRLVLIDVHTGWPFGGRELLARGSACAFTRDDRLLLTNGAPGSRVKRLPAPGAETPGLELWDLATGKKHVVPVRDAGQTSALALSPDGRVAAVGQRSGTIVLWDMLLAREVGRLEGHGGAMTSLAFSHQGNELASASEDTTIVIWNVAQWVRRDPAKRAGVDHERLWKDVTGPDSWAAWQAMWRLMEGPTGDVVDLVRKHVPPATEDAAKRITQLIEDLDSEQFATREAATRELEKLGDRAAAALEQALAGKPSLEQAQRIRRLLARVPAARLLAEHRRALILLEWAGDGEARRLLRDLAAGAKDALLTREAKALLDRLGPG